MNILIMYNTFNYIGVLKYKCMTPEAFLNIFENKYFPTYK